MFEQKTQITRFFLQKTQVLLKTQVGWVFCKKPGFFPTLERWPAVKVNKVISDFKLSKISTNYQGWKKPGFFAKNPTHLGFLIKPGFFAKKPGLFGFFA